MRIRRKLLTVVAVLLVLAALTAGTALADPPEAEEAITGKFTATLDLALIDPGITTITFDKKGALDRIVRAGEKFAGPTPISGGITVCKGKVCDELAASFV